MFSNVFFETIQAIVAVYISYPKVIIAVLKFIDELVDNKSIRIVIQSNSKAYDSRSMS